MPCTDRFNKHLAVKYGIQSDLQGIGSRLAARFRDADKGKVTVGGVNVKTVDPEGEIAGSRTGTGRQSFFIAL